MAKVRGVQKARQIDIRSATKDQLRMYISQEGKRLNWQIAQLEKRGLEKSSFAYQKLINSQANQQYLGTSASGHMKVSLSTRKMSKQQMQALASVINKTVNSQTITPSGIKNYYSSVFNSLRQRYPELNKFTDEQLADIFTTMGFESTKDKLGSDRLMQMIAQSSSAGAIEDYIEKSGGFETIISAEKQYNDIMGANFEYVKTSPFERQS